MCKFVFLGFLLARVGEDDDGPVVMFISKRLDQVDQIGILHLFWGEDVPLIQFLHCSCPVANKKVVCGCKLNIFEGAELKQDTLLPLW